MASLNWLFENPVVIVSVGTAAIRRGERLAEVTERTSEFDTQRLAASMSLEIDTRRDAIGVAEDDSFTVTAKGVLVMNGHSAVVEKD